MAVYILRDFVNISKNKFSLNKSEKNWFIENKPIVNKPKERKILS